MKQGGLTCVRPLSLVDVAASPQIEDDYPVQPAQISGWWMTDDAFL